LFKVRVSRRYLRWVFEAKKRFGLSVLNYYVPTSNDVHLLVKETG
jgi:putative transposase